MPETQTSWWDGAGPWIVGLWIGCAVLCAVIASNKGRWAGWWSLAGLFFGVFGLIAVLLRSRSPEKEAERQVEIELHREEAMRRAKAKRYDTP